MSGVCVNIDGDLVRFASAPTEADIDAWRELRAAMRDKLASAPEPVFTEEQLAFRDRMRAARSRIRVREYSEMRIPNDEAPGEVRP